MGAIISGIRYLCGDKTACAKPPPEEVARKKYLTRRANYAMVEASIPVFISAGISGAAGAVIDSMEADLNVMIIQYAIYCLLTWIVGKYLFYRLVFDEENNSDNKIFVTIREYKMSKLLRAVLSENVGFAWKELMAEVAFTYAYLEYGWGPSFATFIVLSVFFVLVVYISSYIQQNFCNLNHKFNEIMLEFDSDAAALPLSFLLTVCLALGLQGTGNSFISSESYLYSWKEEQDDNYQVYGGSTYDYYFLYASLVSFFVAGLMALENDCIPVADDEDVEKPANNDPDHIHSGSLEVELTRGRSKSGATHKPETQLIAFLKTDKGAWEATVEMFHNFLGYFAGIAWFILIIDNFDLGLFFPHMDKVVASLIAIALAALLISYKGPDCIASMKLRQEKTSVLIKRREEEQSAKSQQNDNNEGGLNQCLRTCYNLYLVVSHKRKDILMLSCRLIIGWTWEIAFKLLFQTLGSTEKDNVGLNTSLQCLLALCILIVSLFIHLKIKDWNAEELLPDERPVPATASIQQAPVSEVIVDSETRSPLS